MRVQGKFNEVNEKASHGTDFSVAFSCHSIRKQESAPLHLTWWEPARRKQESVPLNLTGDSQQRDNMNRHLYTATRKWESAPLHLTSDSQQWENKNLHRYIATRKQESAPLHLTSDSEQRENKNLHLYTSSSDSEQRENKNLHLYTSTGDSERGETRICTFTPHLLRASEEKGESAPLHLTWWQPVMRKQESAPLHLTSDIQLPVLDVTSQWCLLRCNSTGKSSSYRHKTLRLDVQ